MDVKKCKHFGCNRQALEGHWLCIKHYENFIISITNYGDRLSYRDVTETEFSNGYTLRLKNTYSNRFFKFKENKIFEFNKASNEYDILTELPVIINDFCIKK